MRYFLIPAILMMSGFSAAAEEPEIPSFEVPVFKSALLLKPLKPLRALGASSWGRDGRLKLKWRHDAEGSFLWADIDRRRRRVWVASKKSDNDVLMTALDSHGEIIKRFSLKARFNRFKVLERGRKDPVFVGINDYQLIAHFTDGKNTVFEVEKTSPNDFTVVPKGRGRPMIVAAYHYGGAGLRAFRLDGRILWELPELERAYKVSLETVDGKTVLAAADGLGKITLVSLSGKVLERIEGKGNMDRVVFDSGRREGWMYGLDSGAGSWKEKLSVWHSISRRKKGKKRWTLISEADLGRLTVTAFALGDLEGNGRRPMIGTDNGWIVLLDRAGRTVSESRIRGRIEQLAALDLDDDGREELLVSVKGYSGNVFVFTRPKY